MNTMVLTLDEMTKVASQLPLSLLMGRLLVYDPGSATLFYDDAIKDRVEATDKTVLMVRVPETITPLQARLQLIEIGKLPDVDSFIGTLSEPDQSALGAFWHFATVFWREDKRVAQILRGIDTDADDFFRAAAIRK